MSKGYKFRLQKLLDIRLDNEEKSKLQFKEAQRQKLLVEEEINTMQTNYEKYNVPAYNDTIIERKIKQNYLNALVYGIDEAAGRLKEKNQMLEEKRNELKQKQIERKTVEILRDKERAAFMKEQELIEQRNNDEFALYGFVRTHSEGR